MVFDDLERRRAAIERTEENSARVAEAFARFKSTGQGYIEFEKRVDFGLTFIERPYMSYGNEIDLDEMADLVGMVATAGADTPPMPHCTGFVTEWDQDDRGFYVGCWVGTHVWFPYEANVDPTLAVDIYHHFSFKAVAMKDVPIDQRD